MDCFANTSNWYFKKWQKFGIKILSKIGKVFGKQCVLAIFAKFGAIWQSFYQPVTVSVVLDSWYSETLHRTMLV